MKKFIILFTLSVIIISSCKKEIRYKEELKPYINFLEKENKEAKDYILELFEKRDLVILCERDHRENTQYEFLKALISDPRFIKNIGNVFTEVGMRNLNPEINNFIHSTNIADSIKEAKLIDFQQRCSFYPLWEKYNFHFQLNNIYELNQKLKAEEKINLYPTDVAINLDSINVDYLKACWYNEINNRDSLMANYIIDKFENIKKAKRGRKKALIIMNYRHSFNNKFKNADGSNFDNVGRFLFDKYPGKIANILINPLGINEAKSDIDTSWTALQDGKWDAAFKVSNKNNIGFNFDNSPFGKDSFDYWCFTPHNNTYKDVFTGFIYYKHPSDFTIITGVNGLIDTSFIKTYKQRVALWRNIVGDRLENQTIDSIIYMKYNRKNISKKENINNINAQIDKWIK